MLYTWLINHSLLAKSVKYKYMNVPNGIAYMYVGKSGIQVYVNNKPLAQTNNLFIYILYSSNDSLHI